MFDGQTQVLIYTFRLQKDIHNIFIAYTNIIIMLGGAESIGIVVELWFTALQHILVKWSAFSSSNHSVSSSVNASA